MTIYYMCSISYLFGIDGGMYMNKPFLKKVVQKTMTATGIVLCIVMIPLLIVSLTIIVKSYVHPDEVAGFFGYKPFIILSDSMKPELNSGDLILIKETDPARLNAGDIIAYRYGDSVVTHRIVDTTEKDGETQYITRGDANNADDSRPVSRQMVEGALFTNIPKFGNVALFMQTPFGMLLCIGVPVLLLLAYDIIRRRRYDNENKKVTIKLEKELERMRSRILSG